MIHKLKTNNCNRHIIIYNELAIFKANAKDGYESLKNTNIHSPYKIYLIKYNPIEINDNFR